MCDRSYCLGCRREIPTESGMVCEECGKGKVDMESIDERKTPRTFAAIHGCCFEPGSKMAELAGVCQQLEQERDELQAKHDAAYKAHCRLLTDYNAIKDALRVRIGEYSCPECKSDVDAGCQHSPKCRHHATEKAVTE